MADKSALISVDEAIARLLKDVQALDVEHVSLTKANDRVLASDLFALRTQPPFSASAMDGYAVRAADTLQPNTALKIVGQVAAGHTFSGEIKQGETARIFTGAPLPIGADAILIQEDAEIVDDIHIIPKAAVEPGNYVRPLGLDFAEGDLLEKMGSVIDAGMLSLAASANHPTLPVYRKPVVGVLATGDELLPPGSNLGPGQIIASNSYGVAAIIEKYGGRVVDLGIAKDTEADLMNALAAAHDHKCDLLVTLGGASVGDHDLVQPTFKKAGMALDFWKIAMQPGKPLMFGRLGAMRIIGLPGNPVSSLVCSHIFLAPLIFKLTGRHHVHQRFSATLENKVAGNGNRQQYVRGIVRRTKSGYVAQVFSRQDSSILSLFAKANALVIRPPNEGPADIGATVEFIQIGAIG